MINNIILINRYSFFLQICCVFKLLFNKQIPLNTYCKCIIMYEPYIKDKEGQKQKQNIIELANYANIPIKVYNLKRQKKIKGLNKFIDIIESKQTL